MNTAPAAGRAARQWAAEDERGAEVDAIAPPEQPRWGSVQKNQQVLKRRELAAREGSGAYSGAAAQPPPLIALHYLTLI